MTGTDGSADAQTLTAAGLNLAQSTSAVTCGGVAPCGATNQVKFTVSDLAGNVRTAGPYAILADNFQPPAGCVHAVNVGKNGAAPVATIQAAINSVPAPLTADTCVVIRDTETYSEQVTVQGFGSTGYRLTIMRDPTFVSSAPVVIPPEGAEAAFKILNDSVTIQGINIFSTNTVTYGVQAPNLCVRISSVNIVSNGYISAAGILLSNQGTVSYSSVTTQGANGLKVQSGLFNAIEHSTFTSTTGYPLWFNNGASSNTVTDTYLFSSAADAAVLSMGSSYNKISQSTITASGGGKRTIFISASSSNTLSDIFAYNVDGAVIHFLNGADMNHVYSSTITNTGPSYAAVYFEAVASNTLTGSYIYGKQATAVKFQAKAKFNEVIQSSVASKASGPAVFFEDSSSNTVSSCTVTNLSNVGVYLYNNSNYNELRLSTVTSQISNAGAVDLLSAAHNKFYGSLIHNLSNTGYGLRLQTGANNNTVAQSSVSAHSTGKAAVEITGSVNDFYGSYITNSGNGAAFIAGSALNSIRGSTVTSSGNGYSALYFNGASSNTVLDSYARGYIGASVGGSTGTAIGGSFLAGGESDGTGLILKNGSFNLLLATSIVAGAPQGEGVFLVNPNSGSIDLSSNIITGCKYGVQIAAQAQGAALSITSMTFQNLTPGATAINFLGGQFVATFTAVGFNYSGMSVNVNASALGTGSRITMRQPKGAKSGTLFVNDPGHYVEWGDLPAGCNAAVDVAQDGNSNFTAIQAALNVLPTTLSTNTCVVIRDTQTYAEAVNVQNINTNGFRLSIMADPTFVSSAPLVQPESGTGFIIYNDSVTLQGINVNAPLGNGVYVYGEFSAIR
ncbi:MAG TPA: right-handed parallel beta-helix repeat-containing protein, partial [Elusimicrobiales bacterium]|nr:right-handed parallel beta-helix repeat-containing protein [Elusimicrobiales bacterium]